MDSDGAEDGWAFGDDELTALALAADPDAPIPPDAVPFGVATGADLLPALLPAWYMPAPQLSASTRTPRRVIAVGAIVVSLVVLNGVGLCVTYGVSKIAW